MVQTLTCNSEFIFDRICVPIEHVVQTDISNMKIISFFGFVLFLCIKIVISAFRS